MLPIRTILYPTDFSDAARSAFDLACALARDYRATLIVAHVIAPGHVFAPNGAVVPFPTEEPGEACDQLARMHPTSPGVHAYYRLLKGDPAEQILKLATDTKADMVVMATHGTSGLTRLLVGSVAESVMRKAGCPVLTMRIPTQPVPT
ncbi:universal stress protein [Gemmata sp. JC717]|uniref:Universal stress protein n=1 Tax=Gemmata algarum TaxID=2975278 RepID=A0ABU5F1R4_9BACT|nr:universal stress protein [Gemmata algarum]MDY3552569.1 universal stress protein [Gemmata algarum]MDY3559799.1 universal stress protein [Gemmata algarum]